MEQMTLFDNLVDNWQDGINRAIAKISSEEEIPDGSILLDANYSRDGKEITSYSLYIRKPDYPKGTNANGSIKSSLFNIQVKERMKGDLITFCLPESAVHIIQPQWGVEVKRRASDTFVRVIADSTADYYYELSLAIIKEMVDRYLRGGTGNSFGCCHLYKECSDAKKCLHENKLYARGCQYYYNLNAGRIFYGKNANNIKSNEE